MAKEATKKPTSEPTTFFDLPVEVRISIYKLVLPEAVTVFFDVHSNEESHNFHRILRLTCKTANEDLWSRFRPHLTAVFVGFERLQRRMQRMPASTRDQISRVIVLMFPKVRFNIRDPESKRDRPRPRQIKQSEAIRIVQDSKTDIVREYLKDVQSGKLFLHYWQEQLRMAIGFDIAGPASVKAYEGCTDSISLASVQRWRPRILGNVTL